MRTLNRICLLALLLPAFYTASAQTEVAYYTSMGNFKVVLVDTIPRVTVDSFISRVSSKFYDGLIFHRVVKGFVIQGGDPLGDGTGGPGYTTPDEVSTKLKNVTGSLAMANEGPGTNTDGSQFYFNLVNNTGLDGGYTVFGAVTENLSVVQNIGLVAVDSKQKPLTNVVMDSLRITKLYPLRTATPAATVITAIYPNPCRGIFHLMLPATATAVAIVNMQGQVVYTAKYNGTLNVDLHNQPAGLYLVRTENVTGVDEQRLVIQ